MSEFHVRAFAGEVGVDASKRIVEGIAVPFNEKTWIRDTWGKTAGYSEQIRQGAFERTIRERGDKVKLMVGHEMTALPIGKAVHLEETPVGLFGQFRISATRAGDEALQLVRDGVVDSFSIGFQVTGQLGSTKDKSGVTITGAKLLEVSLVAVPAYAGATVTGTRINVGSHDIDWYGRYGWDPGTPFPTQSPPSQRTPTLRAELALARARLS